MVLSPVSDGEVSALMYIQQNNQNSLEEKKFVVSKLKHRKKMRKQKIGTKTSQKIEPKPLNSQNKHKRFDINISALFLEEI